MSTRISLNMPRRLTRTDTFRLLWIFFFRNHYSISQSPWDGMCRPGLAWVDCAGLSGSIHYAESIMLIFLVKRLIYRITYKKRKVFSEKNILLYNEGYKCIRQRKTYTVLKHTISITVHHS